ncbi:acyltransferase [Vibrio sp. DBSS07]|uniref:Acyltransferase n=2 Tax=Vibrio paucivorans TaxID=2829489 RepID=A0A9X3HQ29_9VIBR|nr:acyltransferase [Vibrio paucivorans]MCW8332996.1 acyltransferase [Vibrio paucivorans]
MASRANELKVWLQHHPNPSYRNIFLTLKKIRQFEIPTPTFYNKCLYSLHSLALALWHAPVRTLYSTPAFKGRVNRCGKRLYLYGGVPYVSGPVEINLGNDCRISGHTTFSGRPMSDNPTLMLGNNIDIGWQTTIAVGRKVTIEDNVRIAGRAFLFGYSGHPLDARRRAMGEGDDESQVGDIVLKRDVWLGTNVTVRQGVTIGEGTVVAAGSVVTKDLPPYVIAAGNPAKVVSTVKPRANGGFSHA